MSQKLIKPKALKPGGRIGIVSPARAFSPEMLAKGKAELEKAGYSVFLHPQTALAHHQLGGSDEARANAVMELFADPSVDAILCARGGLGSYRLLPHLDFDVIAKHPKIFCGFSDLTTLLTAFYVKAGLVGFHGPMLWNMQGTQTPQLMQEFKDGLSGAATGVERIYPQTQILRAGKAEGRLIGGNVKLLEGLIGTPYDFDTRGAIFFIEDTEEPFSKFDRGLHHLKNAGKFEHIRGLIIGELSDMMEERYGAWGDDYRELLLKFVPPGVPVLANFPCGHGSLNTILPIGATARLEITHEKADFTLIENPFA